ncbi:hypothetical protein CLAIMM_11472 [Cladophialophora immunda]|nr:hypothetical protein CLAIMM_11472 [Cladophialophora immunda]
MRFRTLRELGHEPSEVTLIDTPATEELHQPHLRGTDIILVPAPSNDVNDPLRFPAWKKWAIFANMWMLTFMVNFWLGGLAPGFYLLTLEFNIDASQATGLLSWCFVAAGVANLFWVPTSEYIGRRPVFILSSILLFVCQIWSASSKSYGSILASRVVGSFMGTLVEGLGPVIVNDIFFLHERGSKMGLTVLGIYLGNSLGTVITGFIIQALGWRWSSWVCSIFSGVNMLGIVFLFPETRWNRAKDPLDTGHQAAEGDDQASEKMQDKPEGVWHTDEAVEQGNGSSALRGVKKSYLQELHPWSGTTKMSLVNHLVRPLPLVFYPAVAYAVLMFSIATSWLVGAGVLSSFIFQVPPYNFSPGVNGLVQIPGFIGNIVGAVSGGLLSDVYARHRARHSAGGKFKPEFRLPLLIIPAIIVPCGLFMWGYGVQRGWHWAILYVGYGFIGVVSGAHVIVMTYAVDSYVEVASDALTVINSLRAFVAFGFIYAVVPWTTAAGYASTFATMAGIWWAILLIAVPLYFFGHKIRSFTSASWKIVLA